MAGFVKIGGLFLPESSKEPVAWCRVCEPSTPLYSEREEVEHARNHVKRDEAEESRREHSTAWKLRELYAESDPEAAAWLKTPAGRAWFARTIERR